MVLLRNEAEVMGRKNSGEYAHLPVRMYYRHGAYYHVSKDDNGKEKWTHLGKGYLPALNIYAELEKEHDRVLIIKANNLVESLYRSMKHGAKSRRIECTITRDD